MMLGRPSGLGRGLGAIIPPRPPSSIPAVQTPSISQDEADGSAQDVRVRENDVPSPDELRQIPVHLIDPNPHQPREHFDHAAMEDLVASIKEHGIMQPVIVTPKTDGRFELIAGERRLRASNIAGLERIPAIVRTATEQQKFELAIIENIQRKDLNPLEEARAYLRLQHEFNLTQDEIGIRVGKSRPQVGNIIRLLQLPEEIQNALAQGVISTSNARTLLSVPTEEERMELFHSMRDGNFTVRQTEARIPHPRAPRHSSSADPNLVHAEMALRDALGAKVTIKRDIRGEGEIKITFLNEEDLNGIVEKIKKS